MKKVDLGTFEEVGYCDVIKTGLSREEMEKRISKSAKKRGVKVNIKYVDKHPKGSVVWDVQTGRCFVDSPSADLLTWIK